MTVLGLARRNGARTGTKSARGTTGLAVLSPKCAFADCFVLVPFRPVQLPAWLVICGGQFPDEPSAVPGVAEEQRAHAVTGS